VTVDVGAVADERWVRVCPQHRLELKPSTNGAALLCPKRHQVTDWEVVDRQKGRAVSAAGQEKAGIRDMDEKAEVKAPTNRTLERKKFIDGSGLALLVALRHEQKRLGGDPFRVFWRIYTPGTGSNKGGQSGVSTTASTEVDARNKFRQAWMAAIKDGWKEVPLVSGTRKLVLKAIPAPRKKAS
jgi:hypothetical protein